MFLNQEKYQVCKFRIYRHFVKSVNGSNFPVFKQKQTASKAYECASKTQWFAQVLFQDTNDDRRDLTLFEDAIHQTAKLTSDTDEVKVLLKQT